MFRQPLRIAASLASLTVLPGCPHQAPPAPAHTAEQTVIDVQAPASSPVPPSSSPPAATVPAPDETEQQVCRDLTDTADVADDHTVPVFMRSGEDTCLGKDVVRSERDLQRVARAAAGRGITKAVLYVDAAVSYANVIRVMDALKQAGIQNLALAVGNDGGT